MWYNMNVVFLRKSKIILCLFFCALLIFPALTQAQPYDDYNEEQPEKGTAWVIPIHGDITAALATFVRREARAAMNKGVEYIIFEIDTFGGRVDAALQITSFITSINNARTIAWINNSEATLGVSWSAGALIALACSEIYMASGTSIGAAAPVIAGPGGVDAAGEKALSAIRSQTAALAERNGHPVGIALAMVDTRVELWEAVVNGEIRALTLQELERLERGGGAAQVERVDIISPEGSLLTLTAGEALRYGLSSGLLENRQELFYVLGVTGNVIDSSPSVADGIISLLTSGPVQTILILLALVMLFLEFQSPGFGVPGVAAVICFLVVFGASAMLGRVGSLEILLFLLGIALLAVEIFVLPGFGVIGILGFVFVGTSLVFSMQDFVVPQMDWEWALFGRNMTVVFSSLLAAVTLIAIIALFSPKIRLFDRIMLKAQIVGTAGGPDPDSPIGKMVTAEPNFPLEDGENLAALVGKTGTADSVLRPSGRAMIDGNIYTVEADNEFVEQGKGIVVTRVRGNRIVVRKV